MAALLLNCAWITKAFYHISPGLQRQEEFKTVNELQLMELE